MDTVIVDGAILMRDKVLVVDEKAVLAGGAGGVCRLFERAGIAGVVPRKCQHQVETCRYTIEGDLFANHIELLWYSSHDELQ